MFISLTLKNYSTSQSGLLLFYIKKKALLGIIRSKYGILGKIFIKIENYCKEKIYI